MPWKTPKTPIDEEQPQLSPPDLPELINLLCQAALGAVPLQLRQPLLQLLDLGITSCILPQPLHLSPQALHLLGVGSIQRRELLRQPLLLLGLGGRAGYGVLGASPRVPLSP